MQRILLPERKREIWPDMVRAFFVWKTVDQRADDLEMLGERLYPCGVMCCILYRTTERRKKTDAKCERICCCQ